jgi:hypothetical protein
MKLTFRQFARFTLLIATFALTATLAQAQPTDTGTSTQQGTVSGYVQIRAGGPATLANSSGGSIVNTKIKGDPLNTPTTMVIDFGEVGPSNAASFVTATIPLRLRTNVSYTFMMSAAAMTYGSGTPDANSVTLADIGFGVATATRDSGGGVAAGSDTIAPSANGDPTLGANGSISGATGRYTYVAGYSLASYTTSATILTGPRIMHAMSDMANSNGLVVTTVIAIKPQFFTPGSFSTSVTFTISNP